MVKRIKLAEKIKSLQCAHQDRDRQRQSNVQNIEFYFTIKVQSNGHADKWRLIQFNFNSTLIQWVFVNVSA